ncbi:hypothetical protein LSAT2_029670 [Lamellibrachia satsuma]|nr:hypothetical protein LSAT2_029670 [Lamellibrachia satsuma]
MDSRADTPDSGENPGSPDAWTSLMSSQNGLDCIIENPDLVHRFAADLTDNTICNKKSRYDLLSALCQYSADGLAYALRVLDQCKSSCLVHGRLLTNQPAEPARQERASILLFAARRSYQLLIMRLCRLMPGHNCRLDPVGGSRMVHGFAAGLVDIATSAEWQNGPTRRTKTAFCRAARTEKLARAPFVI